jgi:hypothetical protein
LAVIAISTGNFDSELFFNIAACQPFLIGSHEYVLKLLTDSNFHQLFVKKCKAKAMSLGS